MRTSSRWLLGVGLAVALAVATAASAASNFDNGNNVRTAMTFVQCFNQRAAGKKASIADTIACLPDGCNVTLTMSQESAQAACAIAGCQLPRVLLVCPGPAQPIIVNPAQQKFRPSYLLCPLDSGGSTKVPGADRVEIGVDLEPVDVTEETGPMKMSDIPVLPTNSFMPIEPDSVVSTEDHDKECNGACHVSAGTQETAEIPPDKAILSKPLDPFSANRAGRIISTDEPGKTVNPMGEVDGTPRVAQNLADICQCISDNFNAITFAVTEPTPPVAEQNIQVILDLCNALAEYQTTRGACAQTNTCP